MKYKLDFSRNLTLNLPECNALNCTRKSKCVSLLKKFQPQLIWTDRWLILRVISYTGFRFI